MQTIGQPSSYLRVPAMSLGALATGCTSRFSGVEPDLAFAYGSVEVTRGRMGVRNAKV